MPLWSGYVAVLLSVKALGGALGPLVDGLGGASLYGPIVALVVAGSLGGFFIRFVQFRKAQVRAPGSPASLRQKRIFLSVFAVFFLVVLAQRVRWIQTHPIDIAQADMIPMVLAGFEDLDQARQPYRRRLLEDGRVQPGYYLPGLWWIYYPLHRLGGDIRYMNLLPTLLLYLMLAHLFLRRSECDPFLRASILFFCLVGVHAFSKLTLRNVGVSHTAAMGSSLVLFLWALSLGWGRLRRIALSLFFVSREIAPFLVFPYLVFLFLKDRREFFRTLGWVFVVTACLNLPFFILAPDTFFDQLREYQRTLSETPAEVMLQYPGLLGVLKLAGWERAGGIFRLTGLLMALWVVYRKRDLDACASMALGGVSLLACLLFVSTTWAYLYLEPLAIALWLIEISNHPLGKTMAS